MIRSLSWHCGGGRRFFSRHSAELVEAHKWCFIVGCNNSGTSLLQSMLEQTRQVSTFPFEGQLYTRVLRRSERRGHERVWTEYVDELSLSEEDSLHAVPRLVHDWLTALSSPVQEVIVEKTPANVVRMEWLQKAFTNSYFVGLVRNGYAVSEGIRRKGHKPVARGARHWNQVNRTMLERSRNVSNFMQVRYEELVDAPDNVIRQLGEFIGMELASAERAHEQMNAIRDDHRTLRNFNMDNISRLSEEDLSVIYENACEMLEYFGYTSRLAAEAM